MGEMSWRKMDRQIIRNENLLYIADQLPDELTTAPWMFYYAALSIADDDGVFDLEDGIVFARLMKVKDPQIVFTVANLMMQRRLIVRANATSSKCIITNWNQKDGDVRTMEMRRQVVTRKIEEEKKTQATQVFFTPPVTDQQNTFSVDFSAKPSSDHFFCPKNDKSAENVDKSFFGDKKCENVDKTEREKERQRVNPREINLERDKETHTERAAAGFSYGLPPLDQTKTQERQEDIQQQDWQERTVQDDVSLVEQALSNGKAVEVVDKSIQVYSVLNTYYAKNNLGFNEFEHQDALYELSNRLAALSSSENPPDIIAMNWCEQYRKLLETSEYYKNQPILPEYMIKPGCYNHVLAAVSKILLNKNSKTAGVWYAQAEQFRKEAEAEAASVGNAFENEFVKYGINPNDPAATLQLLRIKAQQQSGNDG